MYDDDEDSDEEGAYVTCVSCGKSVFHDVRDCPYCHNDPQGECTVCSHCNRSLPPGVTQCPYCKNFTDDRGGHGDQSGAPASAGGRRLPRIFVIAGWLAAISLLLPIVLSLIAFLKK